MKKAMKKTMKKMETGGVTNPNKAKIMTSSEVKSAKPGSKGSGGANMGSVMSSSKVAGKGTPSRAKSSGGVNTPPTGATPSKKMGGATKKYATGGVVKNKTLYAAGAGLMKKGGATKMKKK